MKREEKKRSMLTSKRVIKSSTEGGGSRSFSPAAKSPSSTSLSTEPIFEVPLLADLAVYEYRKRERV